MAPSFSFQQDSRSLDPDFAPSGGRKASPGVATVLALGRALPGNVVRQEKVAAHFCRVTGIDDPAVQAKLERFCRKTEVKTRYLVMSKDVAAAHPELLDERVPCLGEKLQLCGEELLKLGVEAAGRCLAEWGRNRSAITHLVYVSASQVRLPGGDLLIAQALGLSPDVNRVLLCMLGCYGGVAALRVAKDLAENTPRARVLIVTSETTLLGWRPPRRDQSLYVSDGALFGDGAGAALVGADPVAGELPCFELRFAGQSFVPGTSTTIQGTLTATGTHFRLERDFPQIVEHNIEALTERFLAKIETIRASKVVNIRRKETGRGAATDKVKRIRHNDLFWAVHPGGPAMLNAVERRLHLERGKLKASREVLRDFGNVNSSTILYVLDYIRSERKASATRKELSWPDADHVSLDDPEWGVILAFGAGITMEGILTRSLM